MIFSEIETTLKKADILAQENRDAVKSHHDPHKIAYALRILLNAKLLTQENFDSIIVCDHPGRVADAFVTLGKADLLTSENREIVKAHASPAFFAKALGILHEAKLLTSENKNAVKTHNAPYKVTSELETLLNAKLLTQENFDSIIACDHPRVAEVFIILDKAELLTSENREIVKAHTCPVSVALALKTLHETKLLTPENKDIIKTHNNPDEFAKALRTLHEAKLLTPENKEAIKEINDPRKVASALRTLHNAKLLTQGNFDTVIACNNPDKVAHALIILHDAEILTQENRDTVKSHSDSHKLASALVILHDAEILTQENIDTVKSHSDPHKLASTLVTLYRAWLLTPENRDTVKAHSRLDSVITALTHEAGLLTQKSFDTIIQSYADSAAMAFKNGKYTSLKKSKTKIFPASSAIDRILARRQLYLSGFSYTKLKNPVLYRGDERGPEIIFKEGFYRVTKDNDIPLPHITAAGESNHCIATTKNLAIAVGFADNPSTTIGVFSKQKEPYGWVYMIYAHEGLDLTRNKHMTLPHLVQEVVLTGVPPEHIIAAFQIKTTENSMDWYTQREFLSWGVSQRPWQILCTDFKKNPYASVNIDYEKELSEFESIFSKSYFRIPWSPVAEEKDLSNLIRLNFQRLDMENKSLDASAIEPLLKLTKSVLERYLEERVEKINIKNNPFITSFFHCVTKRSISPLKKLHDASIEPNDPIGSALFSKLKEKSSWSTLDDDQLKNLIQLFIEKYRQLESLANETSLYESQGNRRVLSSEYKKL